MKKTNNENTQINKQTNKQTNYENNKKKNICTNESSESDKKRKTSKLP